MTKRMGRAAWISLAVILQSLRLPSPAAAAEVCKVPRLHQGMSYNQARKVVMIAGFQAPALPAYGYSEDDQKVVSECFGDVKICNEYPEINSCSGAGQCAMAFTNAVGNKLFISTYGDGPKNANVTAFEIKCTK